MNCITKWKSPNCNKGRGGWVPDMIVCHISEGSFEGGCTWLCDVKAQASTHFFIGRDGRVAQLVDIKDTAWGNGTTISAGNNRYHGFSKIDLVRERVCSANNYTISIEHEGRYNETHGALAAAQLDAAVELIRFIRSEVKRIYGIDIPADRRHIVGHCDITPRWKPNCPGELYPFDEIIRRLGMCSDVDMQVTRIAQTPVLASPSVIVEQMREWAKDKNAALFFVELAPVYYNLAGAAGIDPAVAYCQFGLETGMGHFGGVIDETYHNPCGMKTKDGGGDSAKDAHMRFDSWSEGIAAHVDHLALYAGADGYPHTETFDPRHFAYLKGAAKTVGELAGKWATDVKYGVKLVAMIEALRSTKVEDKPDSPVKDEPDSAAKHEPDNPAKHEPEEWAREAWEWAVAKKICDGTRPKDFATRQELAAILFRTLKS